VNEAVTEALRQALAGRTEVRLAILFGSTARGTDRPDSDVDVAVLARDLDTLALASDLTRALRREVQVVELDAVGFPMLQAIVRDGVVVAEHERGCAARWRSRALVDLENDRPWFERMRDAYIGHLAADRPA
jgi:predicted nucleotidyltransferase